MNIKVRLSSVLIIAAVCILLFSVFQSQASAKNGVEGVIAVNPYLGDQINVLGAPVSGGPGYISVAGSAFSPMSSGQEWENSWGYLLNTSSSEAGIFAAPIQLPHGATVTKVVAYYLDNHADKNFDVLLMRVPFDSYDYQTMAELSSVGANFDLTNKVDETIQYALVDNQSNSYYVRVWLPFGTNYTIVLMGVRVDYTFPGYLPCVTR